MAQRIIVAALSITSLLGMAAAAQAVNLAPHRAIYDLEISRVDGSSGYSDIEGRLAYELTGSACEGWAVNYRMANRYVQPEKKSQILDTQLTTWESGDGLEMNLNQKEFVDSTLDSEKRLNVKRPRAGAEAQGVMTKPKDFEFQVSGDVLFPSSHQSKLLDEAKQGQTRDVSLVFDGSNDDKTYKAISFIGKLRNAGAFAVDNANPQTEPLRSLVSWPMTISYYPADNDKVETPLYTASFNMYENGVSTDLTFDYGSYALKGKLAKLDMLKAADCN